MKHTGPTAKHCALCKSAVARNESLTGVSASDDFHRRQERLHRQALNRSVRDDVMRDHGFTKVKGARGGTYWE